VRAGELVTTGTCTGIQPVGVGDKVVASFGPLGSVHASFVDAQAAAIAEPPNSYGATAVKRQRLVGASVPSARATAEQRRAMHGTPPPVRVMLVTGASTGVGAALAKHAAAEGLSLALVARRKDALEAVAAECGPSALPIVADVTVRAEVEAAVSTALAHFGHLDVIVNNVGRGIAAQPSQVSSADIDEMMRINVKSTLYGMQAVLPHFQARNEGHIINVSSRLGRLPSVPIRSAYNWAKHFLNGLTANMRDELAVTHPGIAVSLVSPGLIYTDFGQHALHDGKDMRAQPGGQSKEEVASVIMQVVRTRQPDVFTRPGVKAEVLAYLDGLMVDAEPTV